MSGNKVYEARDYIQKDDSATPTERSRSEYLNELPQTSSQPLLNMDNMAALDSVVPAAPTIINITPCHDPDDKDSMSGDEVEVTAVHMRQPDALKNLSDQLAETLRKLENAKRLQKKSERHAENLRLQVEHLNCELDYERQKQYDHNHCISQDASTQLDLCVFGLYVWNEQSQYDLVRSEVRDSGEIATTTSNENPGPSVFDASNPKEDTTQSESLTDSLKSAAEEGMRQSGFVYDETSGLYYDHSTGYYYDSERSLYYQPQTGIYYNFNNETQTYEFHSQVDVAKFHPENDNQADIHPEGGVNLSKKSNDDNRKEKKKKRTKKKSEKELRSKKRKKKESKKKSKKKDEDKENSHKKEKKRKRKSDKLDKRKHSSKKNRKRHKDDNVEKRSEDGEISMDSESDSLDSSFSEEIMVQEELIDVDKSGEDLAVEYPPCIRVMVKESEHLQVGSLNILTCTGATIGRENNMGHSIVIPDLQVSKMHCSISYDEEQKLYSIKDHSSQNGTFLDHVRLSEPKVMSDHFPLSHTCSLRLGSTILELHIHPGIETCDDCEPGLVQAKLAEDTPKEEIQISTRKEKEKLRKQELMRIKNKFGLKNTSYVDNAAVFKSSKYSDKAAVRRKTVGSDHPYQQDDAPASVDVAIPTENKGRKLLAKMGWEEGEGLGKLQTGRKEPIQINIRSRATAGLGSLSAHEWSMDDAAGAVASQKWVQMQQRFEKLEAAEAPRVTTSHTVAGSETDKDTSVSEPRDQTLPQRKVQSAGSEWHKANFSHDGIPCNKQEAPAAPCVLSDAAVVEQAVCEDIVGDTAGQNITTQPRKVQATGIKWHRPKPIFKPNKS